ncbi:MAG: site-specific integrase [Acidaminococcus provencensis]|jgi:integrase|uniref:tyrosine-type recombinase/integrase n=1 Tax=Acidaminococcus provencensis TaxID=2058289 RepID=UPI0023F2ACE3|nr:site-specific integrase [Acidaminococcus provencensis]MCH4095174.1 site-specific integrase [Acidaminococcus provencensis]MCH4097481.1 site-specific integrase [Acidaminococcus provencensis]
MRLPNGYGSVYKLSGHRRRPYVVKKTIDGRQRALGYFESYQAAFEFLVEINHCTPTHQVTFSAVYAAWSQRHFPDVSLSSRQAYSISYRHLSPLHAMPFGSISYSDLQSAIDAVPAGYCTRKKCRVLLSQLYKYAIKNGIVDADLSPYVELPKHVPVFKKKPFTARQIGKLWRSTDVDGVVDVLILIYTGMRVGEYLALTPADIKPRQRYIDIKHSKTAAGIRKIPIHHKILPYLIERKASGQICPCATYDSFRRLWDRAMNAVKMKHTPHECRHTLATLLDRAEVNETTIRMILGHARPGITKGVYTHKTLADLRKAIDRV